MAALGGAFLFVAFLVWWTASPPAYAATPTTTPATVAPAKPYVKVQPRVYTLNAGKAIVLGAVEGLTEYLPISSTGHLLIAEKILKVGQHSNDKDPTDTYTVVIQIGAILAVLGIFRRRFVLMLEGIVGKSAEGRSLLVSLAIAFVPAALIGAALNDPIKKHLLKPWPVVGAWVVGGLVILWFVANQAKLKVKVTSLSAIPWQTALGIGVAQVLALWPGTSRSLVTILAALALGMSLTAAVEFSFLLGFLTLSAATGYELLKSGHDMVRAFGVVNPIIGVVVAGIAAFISVKWMITYLEKHPLTVFGWYRFAIAGLTAILLVTKAI
jgi:undecaprenyl-diphosphatase